MCVKGADASTAGAFSTTVAQCTLSANKTASQCTCVAGQNGDAASGKFCVDKSGNRTLLAACAAGSPLSAECMCGSSDNSKGTTTGYANSKVCVKGADASTAGAFSNTCAINQYVSSGACTDCAQGTSRPAGDLDGVANTVCTNCAVANAATYEAGVAKGCKVATCNAKFFPATGAFSCTGCRAHAATCTSVVIDLTCVSGYSLNSSASGGATCEANAATPIAPSPQALKQGTVVVATTDFSIGVVLAMILLVPLLLFLCAYLYHHCQQVKKEKKAKENNETGTSITGDLELQSNPMTTIINDPPKKL